MFLTSWKHLVFLARLKSLGLVAFRAKTGKPLKQLGRHSYVNVYV